MIHKLDLVKRTHWIFDMDGTLTKAVHDFSAIRKQLELPPTGGIIEAINALPRELAKVKHAQLAEIEIDYAHNGRPQAGATQLLKRLSELGFHLGILTRNSVSNAIVTLTACGLIDFFPKDYILGRESAKPKPAPDGIELLLSRWATNPDKAVMLGDFRYDLEAGRRAGTATVYVDIKKENLWVDLADVHVFNLSQLTNAIS